MTRQETTWQVCTDVQSWSLSKHRCSLRKPAAWGLFALESVFWRTQLGKLGSDGPRRLWIIRQSLYSSLWLCHQGQSLVTLCPEKHVARYHIYTSPPSRQLFLQLWTCTQFVLELVICEFPLDLSPIFFSLKGALTSLQAIAFSTKTQRNSRSAHYLLPDLQLWL